MIGSGFYLRIVLRNLVDMTNFSLLTCSEAMGVLIIIMKTKVASRTSEAEY